MRFNLDPAAIGQRWRNDWEIVAPLLIMGLMLLGYLIFSVRVLLPRWQQQNELAATIASLGGEDGAISGSDPAFQIGAAQAAFTEQASRFLTETEAAAFLANVYEVAETTAVFIVEMQAQPVVPPTGLGNVKPPYDVRQFHLVAAGDLPNLYQFVGQLSETAVPAIVLNNLHIGRGENNLPAQLTLDLHLYTSPFSLGEIAAEPPISPVGPAVTGEPAPTSTPIVGETSTPDVSSLVLQLDAPWAAENWPEVIRLLQEIRQLAPNEPGMREKLYAARVNYGYQLADLGETAAAAAQFEQALAIVPEGSEAEAGLQSLFAPPPTTAPTAVLYVVQRGDTLYSIARRFGSTVDAVKSANGLIGNNITPGQQLIIP